MRNAVTSPTPRRPALEVLVFAVVAYLITWSAGSLILISNHSDLVSGIGNPSPVLKLPTGLAGSALFLSDMGPALAAVLTVALFIGRPGVSRLFKQFTRWRIGWSWYTIALVGPTALSLVAVAGFVVLGGRMDPAWITLQPGRIALTAVGGWAEELGWRGFAQPRLQSRHGALVAAVTVGVIWNVWHQWQLLAPGGAPFEVLAAASSLAYQVSASILMAWIYNSTGASLPSAIAAHVGLNAVRFSPDPEVLVATVFVVAAALVVIVTGPVSLVKRGATPPDPLSPPSGRPAPPPSPRR